MPNSEALNLIGTTKTFGGQLENYIHSSEVCHCEMTFSVFLPPQITQGTLPVLYWLSGLTCTDENFMTKAGAQRYAAEQGLILVAPDTSPRGADVPDDPEGAWDFGLGAGFYLNATQEPWVKNYQMYDYITQELPKLIESNFPVDPTRKSIAGHSMGGHGALTIALKNPGMYRSVSAFSPIAAPTQCPWGNKAFSHYLGDDQETWKVYDACHLILNPVDPQAEKLPLLVDQGGADGFLKEQLQPEQLQEACVTADHPLNLRIQAGYDHSYYFIASFIGEHIQYHAKALRNEE